MYTKGFFIAVDPVGSKFAKAIANEVRNRVRNKVFRVSLARAHVKEAIRRIVFRVTPQTLNKVQQFERFNLWGVSAPKHATNIADAKALNCRTLFARTLINSTNGRGIVEFDGSTEEYPKAPLYTEYIPKKAEYRVHVFNGEVIDVQQKKKRRGFDEDERNTRVRNMANGYVYTREGIVPPTGLDALAIAAVNAVGYQYGAVDIIFNEKRNQCYVLEVNSRPGLMGTTVERYAEALIKTYDLWRK